MSAPSTPEYLTPAGSAFLPANLDSGLDVWSDDFFDRREMRAAALTQSVGGPRPLLPGRTRRDLRTATTPLSARDETRLPLLLDDYADEHDARHAYFREPYCPDCDGERAAGGHLRRFLALNPGKTPPRDTRDGHTLPGDRDPSAGQSVESWDSRADDVAAALAGTAEAETPYLFIRSDDRCLLYPSRVHSFSGELESGKSWLGLIPAADALTEGERVLILDGESDAATVVGRLLALGVAPEAIRAGLDYRRPPGPPEASPAALAAWDGLLAQTYELVVIDGVTEFLARWGVESIDNDAVTRWYRDVPHQIAERTGAAVVLIDHVTKSADGRGRFAIGAQAKLSSLSGAAYLVEVVDPIGVGMLGRVAMRVAKDRPGGVRPHCGAYRKGDRTQEAAVVTLDSREPGRTVVTVDPPRVAGDDPGNAPTSFRPTVLMERVSRLLESANAAVSRSGIESGVTGKAAAVRTAVDVLIAEGYAAADGPALHGGRPSIRLIRPFRQSDPVPAGGTT